MEFIKLTVIILGIYHTARIFLKGRTLRKAHPPVDYSASSAPNSDLWRWRRPVEELSIAIVDDPDSSRIDFNPRFNVTDYVVGVMGSGAYACGLLFFLWAAWRWCFGATEEQLGATGLACLGGVAVFFGAVALTFRQRILALIRTKDELALEYSYGPFLRRRIAYRNKKKLSFRFKQQSIVEYDIELDAPFYEVDVSTGALISLSSTKFYVSANQSQITWLNGGIEEWIKT